MSHISQLPIPAQLRYAIEGCLREKKDRSHRYNGRERLSKLEEIDMIIEALENVNCFMKAPIGKADICNAD